MPATQRPSRSSASSQSQQPQQQPPTTESSISTGSTSNTIKPTLREQLDQAEVAIRKTRDATAQLHYWWRQHLFRLSCMVFLLCFYQARKPSEACIRNIKTINNNYNQHSTTTTSIVTYISGWEAARFIANDSVVEIMGLIMVAVLALFLSSSDPPRLQRDRNDDNDNNNNSTITKLSFSDRHYMIATALIPMQIASFFQNNERKIGCLEPLRERFGDLIFSAAAAATTTTTPLTDSNDHDVLIHTGEDRPFPLSLIFHTVVTLCCCFMNYQMQRRTAAVKQVMDMKKILQNAERNAAASAAATTPTAAGGSSVTTNKDKKK